MNPKKYKFILAFTLAGILLSATGLILAFVELKNTIDHDDVIILSGKLHDDPHLVKSGGRTPVTNLVLSFDKFQGYKFGVRESHLNERSLKYIMENLRSKSPLNIGIQKTDYADLNSNDSWSLPEGFERDNYIPIFYLEANDQVLLKIDEINAAEKSDSFKGIFVSGFLLLIFIVGFVQVLKMHLKEKK